MTQILSHDPRVIFEGREGSITDPVVVREIWCENVYEVNEGTFDDTHVVVDLGANIGAFTLLAASMGAQKVIAVEPEPDNMELLKKNIGNNYVVGTCEVIFDERGVGGNNTSAVIVGRHGDSFIQPEMGGIVPPDEKQTQVDIITLDQLFQDHNLEHIDCLKIDIEGMEGEVIRNASKETMQLCRYITVEYDQHSRDLGAIVEKLSETHQVKVVGEAGGMIFARRY